MADKPLPRDLETREHSERPKTWRPPALLPDPIPEPGYSFLWVRVATLGQADPTNISARFREGYEPVSSADHPELHIYQDRHSRFKDAVEVGGLLLCKIPAEVKQQRDAYYAKQANAQMQAVDSNLMRGNDPRMPLFTERKSNVTFGKGQK